MIKKLSFSILLILILIFSISVIQASDVNATDCNFLNSSGDDSLQLEENTPLDEINLDESLIYNEGPSFGDKNQTLLTSPTTTIYYNGNYQVTLTDSNTNVPLFNKTVIFSINNAKYFSKTNIKGIASVNLKLNPGGYAVEAYFPGDDVYGASNNFSGHVKILPTLKAYDITKYYKASKNYNAAFLDSQGRLLKNRKVSITINGRKYSAKTNAKGIISVPMNFKPGTYKVIAVNPVTGYKLTTSFKILSTITSSDLKKVKGDNKKFIAKFLRSNGKALAKQYVKVKINSKAYSLKTNAKGEVRLSFNQFKQGKYNVVCYNKDGLSRKSMVQVYKIASTKLATYLYTFLQNDTKEIKVKFSTNLNDNSIYGKNIAISIGGMTYSMTTDSKGEVNFKLPSMEAGLYDVKCDFYGNKFFKSSYAENFVTILDTSDTELTVEGDTYFGDFAGTPLNVAFTAGDVPLIKRTVVFTIDNNDYAVTTDYYGIAALPIYLDVGNYTVDYAAVGDSKINGTSGSCQIEVFKRTDTNVSCVFKTSYKDTYQTFNVHLTDFNGTPLCDEVVELVIGGETYYEMTDSNGVAVFYTYLAVGKYDFSVVFRGTNEYSSTFVAKSTNVILSKYGKGINEKNAAASSAYLKSTKNCQVNNAKIKSLVKSLISGLTSDIDKAKAIFNYVRDNINYAYYYDTHKGAVRTLTSKSANCVDQAHLLISMYRTAGLKARYVHGICKFVDGAYGHVWTQVLVDKTWICGDPIDSCNSLGQINNWNTKSYKLRGIYLSLPF